MTTPSSLALQLRLYCIPLLCTLKGVEEKDRLVFTQAADLLESLAAEVAALRSCEVS